MAGTINIAIYSDALVVLGTAGVVVPLVQRVGISPILGYLGAGVLLGPLGLGSFIASVPLLYWFTVVDAKNVASIADLGVVFLLFLIGLELSLERLQTMRRLIIGLGGLQVLLSTAAIAIVLTAFGIAGGTATLIGACLALSSTAIVVEVLSRQGRVRSSTGRVGLAILLAQDLTVVPLLVYIALLGGDGGGSLIAKVGGALLQGGLAIVAIVVGGRLILRPLFRSVAHAKSSELFIAAILFVIVATGVVAASAGMSMALGAFVAGLLLAETEYRRAIEATIEPFKGLLLGIFFFTVGMAIDMRELVRQPAQLIACVGGLIALKAVILFALCRLFKQRRAIAMETALLLAPAGEFAFVGIGLAASLSVLQPEAAAFTLAVTSISMALTPLLAFIAGRLRPWIEPPKPLDPALLAQPEPRSRHAIVIGHGRVGQVLTEMLDQHKVPYIAVDDNPGTVASARDIGRPVYYGNATSADFLKACGLMDAAGLIVTIHTGGLIDQIVQQARAMRADIPIIVRARDAEHARHLYAIGVTDAVPETIEASLQLSEAALVGLGVPTGPVIASVHQKRDDFRAALQNAATQAGNTTSRAIRGKSTKAKS